MVRAGVGEPRGGDNFASLLVEIDSEVTGIPDELETVLDDDVTTVRMQAAVRSPQCEWWARPEVAVLGFSSATPRAGTWNTEVPVTVRDRSRLWQKLNEWTEGWLEVTVAAVDDQWFSMSVVLAGDTAPPLGLQAAMRDNFPGLRFAPERPESTTFRCDESEVRTALPLPVGQDAPGGFLAGAPAGMPIALTARSLSAGRPSGVRIGTARSDVGREIDVTLGDAELLRHVHIVGATGTGKSTLLAGMVHQLAHSGHGALVLDPHGTLVDRIVAELPKDAAERCMVVRADDLQNPVPLNPLAAEDEVGLATAISDIGEMFYELFDPRRTGIVGPRFVDRVAHALRGLAVLRGSRASLLDVPLVLESKEMRAALLKQLTDPRERLWWTTEVKSQQSSDYGELVAWVNSKFESFSGSPALKAILGSGHDAYDPVGAMDDGRIILVDLAKGQTGQAASRLLGYLLLNRFWVAAMNRSTSRRFHVIVDEAHSVMAGSLINMLSEGRKFGISVTAAHQYLGQLDSEVAEALTGNVGTSVVFRANGPHVGAHVKASGGQLEASTVANLAMFHSVVTRNAATDVTSRPFTMAARPGVRTCDPATPEDLAKLAHRLVTDLDLTPLDPADYAVRTEPRRTQEAGGGQPAEASFLDEWLAKRKAAQAAQKESPGDAGGSDRSEVEGV
ncbi:type IV secretory system conjugative DNA transfer family protein [Gordonia bronchialis]|uniref:type IV secretory system conjugative DNA transfer family protein n=1 Tax=Gordonia bronchialis TaxID=2054 RepID=UPI0022718BFB|nr:ATP-binding protein [Gordonia bronchialis]